MSPCSDSVWIFRNDSSLQYRICRSPFMICQEPIHLGPPPCYSRRLTEAGRGRRREQTMGRTAWSPPSLAEGLHPFFRPLLQCRSQGRLPLLRLRLATCHLSSFPRKKVEEEKRVICTSLSLLSFKPLKRRDNKPGPGAHSKLLESPS